MFRAVEEDLVAYRWQPFKDTFPIEDVDLSGATLAMQVRLYKDAPGDPLISLTNSTSPAEGLSVSVETVDDVTTSTIEIRINETTIEGLLTFPGNGVEAGEPVELVYDMHVTATGFPKHRWFQGSFTIEPGATQ